MKTTGVIRKLDELGRITLPIELRRSLNLDVKDALRSQSRMTASHKKSSKPQISSPGEQKIWLNMKERKFLRHPFWQLAKLAGLKLAE